MSRARLEIPGRLRDAARRLRRLERVLVAVAMAVSYPPRGVLMFQGPWSGHRFLKAGMGIYAVCTRCDFLRVRAAQADGVQMPRECPKCGAEVVVMDEESRFAPTHVGRVSRALH